MNMLSTADPAIPSVGSDRAEDNWLPLLAIADTLGGDWPVLARKTMSLLEAGKGEDDGVIIDREDLSADAYAEHAMDWVEKGATVIGGCCGTSPDYIAKIKSLIE